ncbi:ATP-binding cassette subfamily B protein [Paucibacter oligotrophus]|uniref:ATP-binding cassette subfamily B protein n=1 Tax=Roseateles oligotrophus TaxID=1769250 RepID=A0A840LC43_9BURK|nr:ABC transporter ATP-binding protein [Roseateles oligotrophus]MBB4845730.1 ATP-binding cassette subfamily B protein [Roseateles oligotrophus]
MLKTLLQLLGEDGPSLRRYLCMALALGLLSGLTLSTLLPVLGLLLAGDVGGALGWLALLLAGALACWAWRRRVERAGIGLGLAILQGARQRLGEHVLRLPIGWFTPANSARLGHGATEGMMSLAQLPAHVLTPVISGAMVALVLALALCRLHGELGLLALLALPALVAVFRFAAGLARRADERFQQRFAEASRRMLEFAQAQSMLRAFNGEGAGSRRLEQAIAAQHRSGLGLIWRSALAAVLGVWAVQAVFAALLTLAALRLVGGLALGEAIGLVLALLLVCRFVEPLLELASYAELLRAARGQLAAVQALLAARPLPEPAQPQAPRDASVALCEVDFRYAPDEPLLLRALSLQIAPGSMTALVGESGAGKSTLLRLLARCFDVERGQVCVGGVDVRQQSAAGLSAQLAQIFQDSYLFSGSIADNIRVGKPEASAAELLEAVRLAGVAEITRRLPQGLDTPVGEGGARLSGGERQRIAIARALIKDAPILLVDEATAALDAENQAVIKATLARLRGRRTLIVIAHQLSTVAMADQIVVLQGGRVIEQGAPAVLRVSGGAYAQMLAQQQAAQAWHLAAGPDAVALEAGR